MFDSIHGALDSVQGAVGEGGLDLGGGNAVLDPAPEYRRTIADVFAAIIEIFSFLRNMFKV